MKIIISIILGSIIGVGGHYFWIHSQINTPIEPTALKLALSNAHIVIPPNQNSCVEGANNFTVGDAVSFLIEQNHYYDINKMLYGCSHGVCTISTSSCKPWQDAECGQDILRIDVTSEFEPTSFTCFRTP